MEDAVKIKKELSHYQKLFGLGEDDISIAGYLAYVNIISQQVDHLKAFKIKENIGGKKAETAEYDRTVSMWEGLPDMISKMNRLKNELKIEFNPDADKPKLGPTNPQSIANLKTA